MPDPVVFYRHSVCIGETFLWVEEGLSFQGALTGMNPKVIGFWMGFEPGIATPASFVSYAFAKYRRARAPRILTGPR